MSGGSHIATERRAPASRTTTEPCNTGSVVVRGGNPSSNTTEETNMLTFICIAIYAALIPLASYAEDKIANIHTTTEES